MTSLSKSIRSVQSIFHYGSRIRPVRDWLVLLAIFTILLFVSVGWNVWLFTKATNGQKIGDAPVQTPVQIKLQQVKGLFDARATERGRYSNEYRFVDPSF